MSAIIKYDPSFDFDVYRSKPGFYAILDYIRKEFPDGIVELVRTTEGIDIHENDLDVILNSEKIGSISFDKKILLHHWNFNNPAEMIIFEPEIENPYVNCRSQYD